MSTGSDSKTPEDLRMTPVITVFGVGGGGGNAINNMINSNVQGVTFVVANTDGQALQSSLTKNRIQLGKSTKCLGAGSDPEVGAAAAEESYNEIKSYIENSNMIFITAGMGGGTGTGAAPVIARIAKELNILTVGVVTKPFTFEGKPRMNTADAGVLELQKYIDTVIVIENQNLFRVTSEDTAALNAFKLADDVLRDAITNMTDLMFIPGLINLDFADVSSVITKGGKSMMGTGEASGEGRAIKAAEIAISNPLLDNSCIRGARAVLIHIVGGPDMTLYEVDQAATRIRQEVDNEESNIIFGSTFNPELHGIIRVSVVATAIDNKLESSVIEKDEECKNKEEGPGDVKQNLENLILSSDVEEFDEYKLTKTLSNLELNNSPQLQESPTSLSISEEKNKQEKPKMSIFAKIWNRISLKPDSSIKKKDNQDKNSEVTSGVDIYEVPTFLRKKNK